MCNITKILHCNLKRYGSTWQNMMGITCKSEAIRFSTTTNELGMVLKSSYIDYERSCFPYHR